MLGSGQLRALTGHDAADEGSQGVQVPGKVALGLDWIPLRQRVAYGTIPAKVVAHRMSLLSVGCG